MLQNALAPSIADAHARSRLPSIPGGNTADEPASHPYLKVTGPLPLRFDAPPPPPDLTSKPPAGAPPLPPQAVSADFTPAATSPADEAKARPAEIAPVAPTVAKPVNSTPSILPDDTHAATRAEDFLPFFQFPGASNDTTLTPPTATRPPAPGQLPPSSATYQQK